MLAAQLFAWEGKIVSTSSFILYIEDERAAIDLVRTILDMAGYTVVGVTSAAEGLAAMHQAKPDLLLLDLMMPDANGYDVYRAMKAEPALADIPVIIITGRVLDSDRVIVNGLPPVEDYITKPFKPDRLVRAVREVLDA
jgi:CheY-like chemotaxis protein